MIKCNKGKMRFEGTHSTLVAEMTCLVGAFLDDDDLCEGKTRKERLEWFNENIVNLAYDEDKRAKGIQEAARKIAELLGKETDSILMGVLKAMEAGMDDDDDDGEDDDE
jgi:hypothetical protein